MKPFPFLFSFLFAGTVLAQEPTELAYMYEIDAKMDSKAVVHKILPSTEAQTTTTAWYFDGSLVCIALEESGELANTITTHYYIRNDSLVAIQTRKCLTSSEILDLEHYSEAHRDSLGNVDLSQLPTDCMTVCVFYESGKMSRQIEGYDVFDPLKPYAELTASGKEQFTHLRKQTTAPSN